jgi:hypothetical protein
MFLTSYTVFIRTIIYDKFSFVKEITDFYVFYTTPAFQAVTSSVELFPNIKSMFLTSYTVFIRTIIYDKFSFIIYLKEFVLAVIVVLPSYMLKLPIFIYTKTRLYSPITKMTYFPY